MSGDVTAPDTLARFYPPRAVLVPRSFSGAEVWLSPSAAQSDSQTANSMGVFGDMPAIVHRGAATPAARDLIGQSGLPAPGRLRTYGTIEESEAVVAAAAADGLTPVLQHAPPPRAAGSAAWYVPPHVLADLNDKGRLADIVPPELLPARRILTLEELRRAAPRLPSVLKAASRQSSGGGHAVRLCRTTAEWTSAVEHFAERAGALDAVVVEQWIDFTATFCANFVVMPDRTWQPLGCTRQIVARGRYVGSWAGPAAVPAAASTVSAIARVVAESAVAAGYRGIAGLDFGVDRGGRPFVFDLNFRLNGCTPLLLLHDWVCRRSGQPITRLLRLTCRRPAAAVVKTLSPLVDRREAVVLGFFHAEPLPWSRVGVVLAGPDEEAIEARAGRLAAELDAVARLEDL